MKVSFYELLGMIKENKQPKKIVYDNNVYEWDGKSYKNKIGFSNYSYLTENMWDIELLKNNIIVLESNEKAIEEDKKIKKLNSILRINDLRPPYDENLEMIWKNIIIQQNKINEIIDKLEEIK